jgi:hypothetical protein
MRASFLQPLALLLAASAQAAPHQAAERDVAAIPAPCEPIANLDLAASYDRWFAFQKAYLFDKDVSKSFSYYAADFTVSPT